MAEKIETPSPDLSALQADLESSLAGMPSEPALQLDDSLPAKPDAIDAYKNSVGNPITGSNPGLKFSSPSDFARNSLKESSTIKDDPYTKMRPFTYNADYDGANFDRYYGTDAYKTLGFSPYRDNDALYNQKMTFGDQFVRAAGQWGNLMSTGFMSGVKTWGTLFTDPLAPDLESARDMKRAMAIGNISTGGLGGFIGNTFLNSAYSIGIGLEFLAEEAALAAATAFTGGMAGEVTLPAMAARGGMFGRALTRIAETGAKIGGKADRFAIEAERLGEFSKRSKEVLDQASGGNDIKSAINFFNKTIDVINPFEKTAEALRSQRYATDLAKTVGTAGAFADDIIRIKTAASEAKLEGGMVMIDATEKLIDQYRDEHGVDPTGEDLKNIHALASAEARRTTLYNFPAILTTNNLLFATILYPLNKSIGNTTGHLLKETITGDIKAGTKIFSQLEKGAAARIKAAAKSLTKPSIYGEYGMAYMKANLGEGIQENVQEAISNGAINHALAYQKDPAMASYRGYMGYLMDGMKDQLNAQGAETFASGFLMGMFTQPIMTAPAWAMTKGIEKLQNKDKLKEIKDQRDAAIKKQVDTLNDMDINFWGKDLALAVKNGALARDFAQSLSVGDEKGARDSKFALEFQHIGTAIQSGKFEDLMARLADYKNLSPQQALEAFQRYNIGINTEAEAEAALKHIDGVIERANSIKDRYEKVVENFPNPYDYTGLKPGSNERKAMINAYMAWEEAQKNLVFAHSEFENHSNRLSGIADTFSALASEIAKTDTQSLLSTLSMPAMATEIAALRKEISVLGEVERQAAIKKDKEKTLKLLENFYEEIQKYQDKTTVAGATEHLTFYDKALPYERAREAYRKYLNHLAKKNDTILFDTTTDKAFDLVADSLELRREQHNLGRSINVLSNPKGFLLLQKRLQDAFAEENKEARIATNMAHFMMMNDENQILQTLGEMGVKVSEDFLKEYKDALKNGKPLPVPQSFFDPATQKPITFESDPETYERALEAWEGFKRWMEEEHNIPEQVEEEEKAEEGTEEEKDAIYKYDTYDDELRLALETSFNHYKDMGEIPEDMSFGKFLLSDEGKEIIHIHYAQQNIEKNNAKKAAQEKKDGIPLGTKVNPEARATLNQMGYTNTQIDALSREEREKILKGGIPAEDYYKTAPTDRRTEIEDEIKSIETQITTLYRFIGDTDNHAATVQAEKDIKRYEEDIKKLKEELAALELIKTKPVTEEPVEEAIHPDYVGKIVFMTPGSGKTTFVKKNPDAVVDTDELLLETIQELIPSFTPDPNLTPGKNIYEAIRYAKVDKSKLYSITLGKMKAAAARGMTVLTGSPAYFKNADYILLQQDEKLVTKGYDQYNKETLALAELEASDPKFQKEAIILGVFGYAEDVLKASPLETLALYKKTQIATEPISENITIEDINENITPNNLVIAKDRGYDAVYNNKRYAIGNVTENSVSLRSLDGEEITVKPEEISGVAQQEDVVETPKDTETIKNNNTTTEQKDLDIDDAASDLDEVAKNILKNICK